MASNLARYAAHNPDPVVGARGCLNTGLAEDGVVFVNVDPHVGQYCFIGRTSLNEAAAELYGLTPARVKNLLMGTDKPSVERDALKERVDELQAKADKYDSLMERLRELGLAVAGEDVPAGV